MEAILSEYITCVIEAGMTMFFCLFVACSRPVARIRLLTLWVVLLAVGGSAASIAMALGLKAWLPFSMDYSSVTLLPWVAVGLICLYRVTREPAGRLVFLLLLSVQVLHLCRSVTYFTYGVFFPAMTDGAYRWGDIAGFGIPSVGITVILALYCRRLYENLQRLELRRYFRLWLIPLFFILLYLVQTNLYPVEDFTLANGFRIMVCLCAFVTYSQMVSSISHAARAAQETEYHAQLSHQLDLQRARVEDLESHAEEMKRIRHDRRQHVRVLQGLLEKNDLPEALAYLSQYEKSVAASIQPPLCENFVADTLCRRYATLAKQSGIEASISLSLPRNPGVSGSDLAIILGNLWENAVAAALDAEEGQRFIRLRVQTQEEQVLIRMENSYSGIICAQGERFLSTKPGRNRTEGVGIASVRAVADRYGGIADFTYTDQTFTASVLLYKNS